MRLITVLFLFFLPAVSYALPQPADFPQCTAQLQKEALRVVQQKVNQGKSLRTGNGVTFYQTGDAYNDEGDPVQARFMRGFWYLDDIKKRHFITDVAVYFNKKTCHPLRTEIINYRDFSDQIH